ncbi:MAG TPA: nucleotide exchange factor GrpE, partial [Candidatus Limnocylindrales bacterium]|nr:nucleotide exchange factor GrpE [Candidatus Limnocylindrales bacterium]
MTEQPKPAEAGVRPEPRSGGPGPGPGAGAPGDPAATAPPEAERVEAVAETELDRLQAELERLRAELDETRRRADEFLDALQRERAEFINFRRRTAEEREQALGLASESLLLKVVALADDFDRAIEARPAELAGHPWVEGIGVIDRKLRTLLESEGVRPIDASPGRRFDPREHEAIATVSAPGRAEGEIVEEVQRGYRLRDRVLRAALVKVAGPPEAGD